MKAATTWTPSGPAGTYFVRPEHIGIGPPHSAVDGENLLDGVIEQDIFLGPSTAYRVRVGEAVLLAQVPNAPGTSEAYPAGSQVSVRIAPAALKRLAD
jgi:ABC-type Fe3+/spermidine/putrescine transport system ATPase subunit